MESTQSAKTTNNSNSKNTQNTNKNNSNDQIKKDNIKKPEEIKPSNSNTTKNSEIKTSDTKNLNKSENKVTTTSNQTTKNENKNLNNLTTSNTNNLQKNTDNKLSMKELIEIYKKSQNLNKDSIKLFPQILQPIQRQSSTKQFSKISFETSPCGNSNLITQDKTLVTIDYSKNMNFSYQIHGEFEINQNFKNNDTDIVFKKPSYPQLKCKIKLFDGLENSKSYQLLHRNYQIKYNLNKLSDKYTLESQNKDIDNLSQFDCSNAINTTSVIKLVVPEIECSPCTLSLQVLEPTTERKFQNCADVSIVNPENINSNTCVNKCLNRGICMNNRCHCEFFYRGQFCESYIGSATFRAIFQFLFYIAIVAIFAIVVQKWKEITCSIPEWVRQLRRNQNNPDEQNQLNDDEN